MLKSSSKTVIFVTCHSDKLFYTPSPEPGLFDVKYDIMIQIAQINIVKLNEIFNFEF